MSNAPALELAIVTALFNSLFLRSPGNLFLLGFKLTKNRALVLLIDISLITL